MTIQRSLVLFDAGDQAQIDAGNTHACQSGIGRQENVARRLVSQGGAPGWGGGNRARMFPLGTPA